MGLRYAKILAVLLGVLTVWGCSGGDEQPPSAAAPAQRETKSGAGHSTLPQTVIVPPQLLAEVQIETEPVVFEALPTTVELTGEITPDPDLSARVVARALGRIVEMHFKEGDRVKRGALLAVISSSEVADARAAVTSLSARANAARANADRLKRLGDKGLASAQEVATAAADANAFEADEAAARQRLSVFGIDPKRSGVESSRLELRAPINGYVLKRDGVTGQAVESGHEIASIASFDRAFFLGRLFEKDLAHVEPGAGAQVRLNAYPRVVFEGKVDSIGRQIDPQTRTVLARIAVQDQDSRLKAGLFGVARVVTKAPAGSQPRIVVPSDAVTRVGGSDIVFVERRVGEFEVHQVTLARSSSGKVEVLSGLKRGERVAVSGVFALKSTLLKGTFGEEED